MAIGSTNIKNLNKVKLENLKQKPKFLPTSKIFQDISIQAEEHGNKYMKGFVLIPNTNKVIYLKKTKAYVRGNNYLDSDSTIQIIDLDLNEVLLSKQVDLQYACGINLYDNILVINYKKEHSVYSNIFILNNIHNKNINLTKKLNLQNTCSFKKYKNNLYVIQKMIVKNTAHINVLIYTHSLSLITKFTIFSSHVNTATNFIFSSMYDNEINILRFSNHEFSLYTYNSNGVKIRELNGISKNKDKYPVVNFSKIIKTSKYIIHIYNLGIFIYNHQNQRILIDNNRLTKLDSAYNINNRYILLNYHIAFDFENLSFKTLYDIDKKTTFHHALNNDNGMYNLYRMSMCEKKDGPGYYLEKFRIPSDLNNTSVHLYKHIFKFCERHFNSKLENSNYIYNETHESALIISIDITSSDTVIVSYSYDVYAKTTKMNGRIGSRTALRGFYTKFDIL